jgi:excisionase family DNA binding protein
MTEETILELVKDGAAGVAEAGRFTGLSRTRLYELMQAGAIRYFKCGARRLILRSELQRFLAEQALRGQDQ